MTSVRSCCNNLEVLNIRSTNVANESLKSLRKSLPSLRNLDVSFCQMLSSESKEDIIWIDAISVAGLKFFGEGGFDGSAASRIDLSYADVSNDELRGLRDVTHVNLEGCSRIGDEGIQNLLGHGEGLPTTHRLTGLNLADTLCGTATLAALAGQKMVDLNLFYCPVSDYAPLRNLTSLVRLNMDGREVGDRDVSHIVDLVHLEELDLFSARITDLGCGYISHLSSLRKLQLCGGGVGDLGVARICEGCPKLTNVNFSQNERITDVSVASVCSDLKELRTINLSNTRVSRASLWRFSACLALESLCLYGACFFFSAF